MEGLPGRDAILDSVRLLGAAGEPSITVRISRLPGLPGGHCRKDAVPGAGCGTDRRGESPPRQDRPLRPRLHPDRRRPHRRESGGKPHQGVDGALSLWEYVVMEMTIELPDVMFRQAKAFAAARGVTLRRFFTEALEVQLLHCEGDSRTGQGGPMAGFGALSDLADEHRHVLGVIEEELEKLAPEDRP